jgi:hypothetical protein
MQFLVDDIQNLFIGFVKPTEQKKQKDFFEVLIRNVCDNSKTKTFREIFDSACSEFPAGSVGSVSTPDFDFQLRFCEEEGWSYLSYLSYLS